MVIDATSCRKIAIATNRYWCPYAHIYARTTYINRSGLSVFIKLDDANTYLKIHRAR